LAVELIISPLTVLFVFFRRTALPKTPFSHAAFGTSASQPFPDESFKTSPEVSSQRYKTSNLERSSFAAPAVELRKASIKITITKVFNSFISTFFPPYIKVNEKTIVVLNK
jgi:hypothetical protein